MSPENKLSARLKRVVLLGRRRPLLACCLGGLLLLPLSALVSWGFGRAYHHAEVLPGVWVNEFVASGLEREELEKDLRDAARRLNERPVKLHLEGMVFSFEPKQIGARVRVSETASEALLAGRNQGFFSGFAWWLSRLFASHRIGFQVSYDRNKLEKLVGDWERAAISDPPMPGEVRSQGGHLLLEEPRVGRQINRRMLAAEVENALGRSRGRSIALSTEEVKPSLQKAQVEQALEQGNYMVRAPLELASRDGKLLLSLSRDALVRAIRSRPRQKPHRLEVYFDPEAIDSAIKKDKDRLESEPVDASFRVGKDNTISIVPGRPGTRLDAVQVAEALTQAVYSEAHIGELPVDRDRVPKFTTEDARRLNIVDLVGRFSTRHACCQPRVENIHRIADILDGTLVLPDETFSVNEKVGPRTKQNGFVPAPTIVEGDMEDTVGGGVSQFATTLFNALFYAGYDIIERQPHSYWFPRYPMGHEATLSYPKPDIIFKNDTKSGLLIKTEYSDNKIVVKLFGHNEGRQVKATVSQRQDVIDPPVQLVPDPSMEPDEEKTLEAGMVGWSVVAGRIITFPDKTQKVEKRKVTYMPRVRRVRVHPCRIPEGEEGHTGEACPEPEDAEMPDEPFTGERVPDAPAPTGAVSPPDL